MVTEKGGPEEVILHRRSFAPVGPKVTRRLRVSDYNLVPTLNETPGMYRTLLSSGFHTFKLGFMFRLRTPGLLIFTLRLRNPTRSRSPTLPHLVDVVITVDDPSCPSVSSHGTLPCRPVSRLEVGRLGRG